MPPLEDVGRRPPWMKIKCPLIPLKGKPSQLEDTTASRDRIVVSTLRCGRSNPGSNPGHSNSVRSFKLLHAANKKPQGLAFTPIPGLHCLAILPASQSRCPLLFDRTALPMRMLVGPIMSPFSLLSCMGQHAPDTITGEEEQRGYNTGSSCQA